MPIASRFDAIAVHGHKPFDAAPRDAASFLTRLQRESLALEKLRAALEADESHQRFGDQSLLSTR